MSEAWHSYDARPATGRGHETVSHRAGESARDDEGDGVRDVHGNSLEGFWLGLRNFLRPFRGVSKWWLDNDVHFDSCLHNFRWSVDDFRCRLFGPFSPTPPMSRKRKRGTVSSRNGEPP